MPADDHPDVHRRSPGSTAGWIKTTTVGLIGLLAWSRLRGRQIASVGGRSIREETLRRAVGLIAMAFVVIMVYISIEFSGTTRAAPGSSFLAYMVEATSAFNTVGLSMGVTDGLSTGPHWLTIVLMYVGRVGPLAVAASLVLSEAAAPRNLRYSYEGRTGRMNLVGRKAFDTVVFGRAANGLHSRPRRVEGP